MGNAEIAQQAQAVGDIGGTAAEFAAHVGHQKGDIQDVDLVGKDVGFERSGNTKIVSKATEPQINAAFLPRVSLTIHHPSPVKRLFYQLIHAARRTDYRFGPPHRTPP